MRMTGEEFRNWAQKSVTLLGMSGVGKTVLSSKLRYANWFHYSGDYRIGTRYLDEAMLDNIKREAMQVPFLRELLRSDSVSIDNKLSFENLKPLSLFLGKLGNPDLGGLTLDEFKRRQKLHREAEIKSMLDVPMFIERSRSVYGYDHFINDAGGSVCELDNPNVLTTLNDCTVIVYIKATKADEKALVARQLEEPKPMYYREAFLDENLEQFMTEHKLSDITTIDPDGFVRWIFPNLFYARIPRYEVIAKQYGCIVTTDQVAAVESESDFIDLVAATLDQQ